MTVDVQQYQVVPSVADGAGNGVAQPPQFYGPSPVATTTTTATASVAQLKPHYDERPVVPSEYIDVDGTQQQSARSDGYTDVVLRTVYACFGVLFVPIMCDDG